MDPLNDPALRSFVPVAAESHFPIQNLPLGVFSRTGGTRRIGTAIGDFVLDLQILEDAGLLRVAALGANFFQRSHTLNELMARGQSAWREVRAAVSRLLRH